ncbi:MAG: ribonuclease H-like domain-containing protein [Bacteroidia bacterium]|nr:ribonuclease H-like domain-containing protein [Bacteroidia bacterium]MDW8159346.1 ribonuclease H-like domain-containing protein [Bacteroidia bacterium]
MLTQEILSRCLFLDIETVPIAPEYSALTEPMQKCWEKKVRTKIQEGHLPQTLYDQMAGISAEFAKIICISCGVIQFPKEKNGIAPKVRILSFTHEDEKELILSFWQVINRHFKNASSSKYICGHNIKEFDIPFICRRAVIHQLLPLPTPLQLFGKRPWEVQHLLDTMEFWKFGDNKAFTSLELLALALGIPSPKNDLDGSQIAQVYWQEQDIKRIKNYCEQDVKTTIQVALRLAGLNPFDLDLNS